MPIIKCLFKPIDFRNTNKKYSSLSGHNAPSPSDLFRKEKNTKKKAGVGVYRELHRPGKLFHAIGLMALCLILFNASWLWADQATLVWDANNPSPDGYRLYQRTDANSYNYDAPVWTGNGTSCTIAGLTAGVAYHFVVRAYVGSDESADSNEVVFQPADTSSTINNKILPGNDPPVADAGTNQTVTAGTKVTLNGTGSYDPDGKSLTYRWSQTHGATVQLSAVNIAQPTFTTPQVQAGESELLVFELNVTDSDGLTGGDTCIVRVNPPSADSGGDPSHGGQNHPPMAPAMTSPTDGEAAASLTPLLKATDFSDPDAGDKHAKTEWVIMTESTQQMVFHAIRTDGSLTHLRVPRLILDGTMTYACYVRYFDDSGLASEWSPAVTFTTICPNNDWCDINATRTPSDGSVTDLNENDVPDGEEPQVIRTVWSLDGQTNIGIGVDEITSEIEGAAIIDPNSEEIEPGSQDYSVYDLFTYRIVVDEPGEESLVKIYFNKSIDHQTEWICQDASGQWRDEISEIYLQDEDPAVIRMIEDGGPEDADGTINGVIIDILGVRKNSAGGIDQSLDDGNPNDNAGAAGGSSCFIGSLFE